MKAVVVEILVIMIVLNEVKNLVMLLKEEPDQKILCMDELIAQKLVQR